MHVYWLFLKADLSVSVSSIDRIAYSCILIYKNISVGRFEERFRSPRFSQGSVTERLEYTDIKFMFC